MGSAPRTRLRGVLGHRGGALRARAVHRRGWRRQLACQTCADVVHDPELARMLFVATVHYRSERWVEIQTRHLREHINVPYQTWTSLEGIDPAYSTHFD